MENENITITLTVAQWNVVMAILGNAPFNHSAQVIQAIHLQAQPQLEELQKKYPPEEPTA